MLYPDFYGPYLVNYSSVLTLYAPHTHIFRITYLLFNFDKGGLSNAAILIVTATECNLTNQYKKWHS